MNTGGSLLTGSKPGSRWSADSLPALASHRADFATGSGRGQLHPVSKPLVNPAAATHNSFDDSGERT